MKRLVLFTSLLFVFLVASVFLISSVTPLKAVNSLLEEETTVSQDQQSEFIAIENPGNYPAEGKGCLSCHDGIETIRQHNSGMALALYEEGEKRGDPNACTVCHAGNNNEEQDKALAHEGLIKYPGSIWVLDKTCGICHEEHAYNMHRSLMQTEAGKIQGGIWGWGAPNGYKVVYGNYDIDDPDGRVPKWGTESYKSYMKVFMEEFPDNFPESLKEIPKADVNTINDNPQQAIYTYLRSDCQRCHVGVQGAQRRGDYHGFGCSACHIPYSVEGLYEGKDKTISLTEPGHPLVHSIQSSRKAKVKVNDISYSGIPSEYCSTCHNRGKRIGVSFLGIVESAFNTPWDSLGKSQPKLHGKLYQFVQSDHHHTIESRDGNPEGRLVCQDCHTTIDMHGDGNIFGTTLAQVEIECTDCHGTPDDYPWELPLGFGDEFGRELDAKERGVATNLLPVQEKFSTIYEPEDGYLLTARGNPFGNVVRRQNKVIVHTAGGLDFYAPTLKELTIENTWKNPKKAITAMKGIKKHIANMECYSCHADWAPQCYGCHVKVDYSNNVMSTDWIETGKSHFPDGETIETKTGENYKKQYGKPTEGRTYVRWEDPILGVNGESRVTPVNPGCQQITTVIGPDGRSVVHNKIWRTPPNLEHGGEEGQRGIDMAPTQPHTITARARDCVSCHTNPKVMGYGISDGKFMRTYAKDEYVDVKTNTGELISSNSVPQFYGIPGLTFDLSQIVTRDGKQLQTVGHHWPLSAPLSQDQRERMERVGVCIACHQDIPDGNIAIAMMSITGELSGMTPHSDSEHSDLLNMDLKLLTMMYISGPILLLIAIIILVRWRRSKKRRKAADQNDQN